MKISDLPKSTVSSTGDQIAIVQGGKTKVITKNNFLKDLKTLIKKQSKELAEINKKLTTKFIDKESPSFSKPVKGKTPTSQFHLSTKKYVDDSLHNVIRNDGSVNLNAPLSFRTSPKLVNDLDLITKEYVDTVLTTVLKSLVEYSENTMPVAYKGDVFIFTTSFDVLAKDGPEVQAGDILICLEDSKGGTYSEVVRQFAILNTNVVSATEEVKGIIQIASADDMDVFESDNKVLTPFKYKQSLDDSSIYNRTLIDRASYIATESDRGILAVDNRRVASVITLPNISSLKHPNMFKITIKDEFGQADLRTITIKAAGSTIDSKAQMILSNKYQAITIYNDGKNYYVENNTHVPDETSARIMQSGIVYPASTGSAETMYQADIDLSQFDMGQGFSLEVSGFFAANSNTKTVILDIDGTTTVTNATTTAPNSDNFVAKVTVLKEARYAVAYGYMLLEGIAADTYVSNALNMDWDTVITAKVTANSATTNTDIQIYSMILEPLK